MVAAAFRIRYIRGLSILAFARERMISCRSKRDKGMCRNYFYLTKKPMFQFLKSYSAKVVARLCQSKRNNLMTIRSVFWCNRCIVMRYSNGCIVIEFKTISFILEHFSRTPNIVNMVLLSINT